MELSIYRWLDYQIKNDLHDFEIERNLENLKLMSKDTYKKLIKRKAHDYAFNLLCRSKETYKKLNGLNYYEFKIQNYLLSKDYSLEEKTLIFKYRTRMLNLGENFRAGREYVVCPLCKQHKDSQNNLLNCPTVPSPAFGRPWAKKTMEAPKTYSAFWEP